MSKVKSLIFIVSLFFSFASVANTQIKNIELNKVKDDKYELGITFKGKIPENAISQRKGMFQVALEKAIAWPKIEKVVPFGDASATLMAYQYDKDTARVRVMLPNKVVLLEKTGMKSIDGNTLWVTFDLKGKNTKTASYDEKYLDKLISDVKKDTKEKKIAKKDTVKIEQSAVQKKSEGTFDLTKYVGKFVAFIAVMLLGLYGFFVLFKKSAFSKSKLNFLKNMNTIEVLNTNYIGPKRNLMLVKVQGQVFLIGNSEKGMHFLSEIDDVTGFVKDQEQKITGNNFDSTLDGAEEKDKTFKLKEIQSEIAQSNSESKKSGNKKLSDQIKSKVKDMKALQ